MLCPWQSVYARFWLTIAPQTSRWTPLRKSVYEPIPARLIHKSSPKCQRQQKEAVKKTGGPSRGGLNTKIHAIVDGLGIPVEFLLSQLVNLLHCITSFMTFLYYVTVLFIIAKGEGKI